MRRSFRWLLTLILVTLAIVPVLVLSAPFTSFLSRTVQSNAERETQLIAEGLARDLQSESRMLVAQALALSRDSDIQRGTRSILFTGKSGFLMKHFLDSNPLTGGVYLLDETFKLNAAVPSDATGVRQIAFAREAFHSELPEIRGYFEFLTKGELLLLAVPVAGPLDRPTGLLIVDIPISKLQEFIASRAKAPTAAHLVFEGHADAPPETRSGDDFSHETPVLIRGFEGVDKVKTAGPVMSVVVREPRSVRLAGVRATLRRAVLGSILLMLLAGAAGVYLASRLNRPFLRLNEHLKKYEAGDYAAPVPVFALDEFKLIARSLEAMARKINDQIREAAETERVRGEVERSRLETELHSLHQQMQPHFLFNTLNSIGAMIHIDADRAVELVTKFSDLYRLILDMNRTNTVPLQKELEVVAHYLELQRVRFGERLRYRIEQDPALGSLHVPGLMIQTLVENAIKHGIAKARDGGEILVRLTDAGEKGCYCEISNTGGALTAAPASGEGTGLRNTERRLTLLYGTHHGFRLATDAGRTVASFTFSGRAL